MEKNGKARRLWAVVGSAAFLVVAPGMVAGLVPWWISGWHVHEEFRGLNALRVAGALMIAGGAIGLLESFTRFALQGVGTPAPVFPTWHLIVDGLYRFVRNPMYLAVVAMVLGQGLLFGNIPLLEYTTGVWLALHGFVVLYEEPTLRRRFGAEYEQFCLHVPRWIPRPTSWKNR